MPDNARLAAIETGAPSDRQAASAKPITGWLHDYAGWTKVRWQSASGCADVVCAASSK